MVHILVCRLLDASVNFSRRPGSPWCAGCKAPPAARRHPDLGKGRRRNRRMAGDDGLNAHKRQPGDIPVVDKLLAAGAVLHAQTKRHRSSVSFRWTWSPAFGRHPQSLEAAITVGSIYPGAPTGLPSVDHATRDCSARAHIPIPPIFIVPAVILLRGASPLEIGINDCHGRPPQVLWNMAARHEPRLHAILNDRHKFFRECGQCPFLRAACEQGVFGDGVERAGTAFTDQEKREVAVEAFAVRLAGCKFHRLGLPRR